MTPQEFEFAIENDFRNKVFDVTHVGKSFYKGVDFIAENEGQRIAVQVKMYENRIVRYQEVMYLFAGQKLYDCTKSVFITINKIDPKAKKIALKLGVEYFENYITNPQIAISKILVKQLDSSGRLDFFKVWQKYIKPLKGKILNTSSGKGNIIADITNNYLHRISSNGNSSKIEYKIFETIFHRLLEVKSITRDQINTEYTKRGSSIITVVLNQIPGIQLAQKPKTELRLTNNALNL